MSEPLPCFGAVQVRHVNEAGRQYLIDRLPNSTIAVSERIDSDTAREIQIALACFIEQLDAFSTHKSHRSTFVRRQNIRADVRSCVHLARRFRCRCHHDMLAVRRVPCLESGSMIASRPAIRTAAAPCSSAENPASSFACIPLFTTPVVTRSAV